MNQRVLPVMMLVWWVGDAMAGETDSAQAKYQAAVQRHPALIRYYTFDKLDPQTTTVPSAVGEAEPLTWAGKEPFTLSDGFWPGSKAVRFDDGCFQAKPVSVGHDGVTFEMRFRKHGQGKQLGNGRPNGMLFAQGDGYWSGLRVWSGYPERQLHFEIGRPKPSHSFGMTATEPAGDGVWQHVAASWDGEQMRVYLNGILVHAAKYDGAYTDGAPLRIGFANAGIGSLKLDVQEVAIYRGARSPLEILSHAGAAVGLPRAVETLLQAGTDAVVRQDWTAAGEAFSRIAKLADAPPWCRAAARMAVARSLRQRNRTADAVAAYAAIYADSETPEPWRDIAMRQCLPGQRNPVQAVAPKSAYEKLLALPDLAPQERMAVRLCLAERHLQDGQAAAAREQVEQAAKTEGVTGLEAWNLRLQIAHTYLAARQFAEARQRYNEVASAPGVPAAVRGLAWLDAAETFAREKAHAAAAEAFDKVAAAADVPRDLRREARERAEESRRLARGLAARDPLASRVELPASVAPTVKFFVAPGGADTNPGTEQQPFASLSQARDALRHLKTAGSGLAKGGVAVIVRGGTYTQHKTFELTAADSGTAEAPVEYRAAPGETPVFTGGVVLKGFSAVTDPAVRARLPGESRGKVFQVNVREQGVADLGSLGRRGYGGAGYPTHPWVDLYIGGEAMPLARWPNSGSLAVGRVHRGDWQSKEAHGPGEFEFAGDRPARWQAADDVWMWGAWVHLWAGNYVRVTTIDAAQHRVTAAHGGAYGFRSGQPFHFLNVLEEIDQPGEWYLDRKTGLLYLYPPPNARGATVQLSVFDKPFVTMADVRHVTLRGLTFETGRAEGVVIRGGSDVLVAGCTLRQLGGNAVVVDGGVRHGVLGCDIHSVGAGGVRLAGGDRKTLTPCGNFVENCDIRGFSRVDRVYAPAVHVDGVGCRVAHNLMHDSPHHALRIEGYEHAIEFNEIHSVVYEYDDQAGIDIFGNPAYRGIVIRHNFWHHIGSGLDVAGQAGIRLDDAISDVLMYGNVFYRCSGGHFGGIQIHGGKDNVALNNLFVDCKYAFSFSPWGQARWEQWLAEWAPTRAGADIRRPPYSERYPDLARMAENADRNFLWRNLAVACGQFAARDRNVNELLDNCVFTADPRFADPAARNFALEEDSPVYTRFGFRPIPFSEIGLYQAPHRATWPVPHTITPHYVRATR